MKRKIKILVIGLVICLILSGSLTVAYIMGLTGMRHNDAPKEGQIKIACVGDSITYGYGITKWKENNYPAILQDLLKDEYHVHNYGVSGYCVQDDSNKPYQDLKIYKESLNYDADIVVFMMGTNDSKPYNWKNEEEFKSDLLFLLDSYNDSKLILCTPAKVFKNSFDIKAYNVEKIVSIVIEVAKELDLEVVDIHKLTSSHPEWFLDDGVHPNNDGAKEIAKEIYKAIAK